MSVKNTELQLPTNNVTHKYLEHPMEIKDFDIVTRCYPVGYFNVADIPMLERYVKCLRLVRAMEDNVASQMAQMDTVRFEKSTNMMTKQIKLLVQLATVLRITTTARIDNAETRKANSKETLDTEGAMKIAEEITDVDIWTV